MKKILLTITLAVILLGIISPGYVYAEDSKTGIQNADVAISEENFPNEYLREEVLEKADKNNDGYLQTQEIKFTTSLNIEVEYDYSKDADSRKDNPIVDCKGLEYFTNLEELFLSNTIYGNYSGKRGYINFDKVYQLKKLKKLTIFGDNLVNKWYFNRLPNLNELQLSGISKVKKIKVGKKLRTIEIEGLHGQIELDLSGAKNLKTFSANTFHIKKLKFGRNNKLRTIDIWENSENKNKTLKKINVSKVKNLRTF